MKISVIFEALTGSFDTDIQRSARLIDRETARMARNTAQRQAEMREQFAKTGKAVALYAAGITAGAIAIVKSQIEQISKYQELSDKIGDTAENIASLKAASDLSGVGFDAIAAASVKLTAALSKTDDESKGVGAALAAIGLELESFRTLAPIDQIEAVAEALSEFRDGAGKTAIAVALFGKSGADLLPLFQDLADGAERQITLTQEQILAVDVLGKSFDRSKSGISSFAQSVTADLAPSLLFLSEQIQDGAKNSEVLDAAVKLLTGSLGGLALAGIAASNAVQASGRAFFAMYQGLVGLTAFDLDYALASLREGREGIEKDLDDIANSYRAFFGEIKLIQAGADMRPDVDTSGMRESGAAGRSGGARGATEADRLLELSKALAEEQAARDKATQSIAEHIAGLREELATVGLSREQIEIRTLALEGATDEQIEHARQLLETLDAHEQLSLAQEEAKRLFEETRTPLERLNKELERLQKLRSMTGPDGKPLLDADTADRAAQDAQDAFDRIQRGGRAGVDRLPSFAEDVAREVQFAFEDALFDPFNIKVDELLRNFLDAISRMAAERISLTLFEGLGGQAMGGAGAAAGGGGGFLGGLAGLFSGVPDIGPDSKFIVRDAGGYGRAGQPTMIGTGAQPEMFIPQTPGTFTPASEWMQPPTVNTKVVNAIDPKLLTEFMASPDGEQVIVNVISRNAAKVRSITGSR